MFWLVVTAHKTYIPPRLSNAYGFRSMKKANQCDDCGRGCRSKRMSIIIRSIRQCSERLLEPRQSSGQPEQEQSWQSELEL